MSIETAAPAEKPLPLHALRKHRRPLRNVNQEAKAEFSLLDRVALWITVRVGTMGFFLAIFAWTVIWLGLNTLLPTKWRFDPATGFVLYLFLCNVIQILLMPLIMVGQNLQGRHSELRAENDLEVNIKAEKEIEVILQHLEYQNQLIIAMVQKLGCEQETALAPAPTTGKPASS
ncbi:MAG TPA: DUF1003 domain-containing protein [Caulobacteraceae bacterium]|nr:DUF1003 domain-containing protein [Caulobacteraceae bacterium]